MIYQWKTGARIKTDPVVALNVMSELDKQGRLNAETLVEVSKPEDAPMHNEFEWNDQVAADEWRKQQARCIIHSITYIDENDPKPEPTRVFFNIEEHSGNYTAIQTIIKSEDKTEALKSQALKELQAFTRKYRTILKAINAEAEITALQTKLAI